ncbi:hypothetical protein ACW4TU_00210 [Streptomyces sp. QTS52]
MDWIPEVHHPIGSGEAVIPDALLYCLRGPADADNGSMLRAFVEVDRATMGPERLAAKLTRWPTAPARPLRTRVASRPRPRPASPLAGARASPDLTYGRRGHGTDLYSASPAAPPQRSSRPPGPHVSAPCRPGQQRARAPTADRSRQHEGHYEKHQERQHDKQPAASRESGPRG